MKRTERQHLKDNELRRFALQARDTFESRKREATVGVAAVVVVLAVAIGYFGWRDHTESRADGMLAEALAVQDARVGAPAAPGTPNAGLSFPTEQARAQAALAKFKAAADAYPSSDAGIFARYQEATTNMALGNATAAAALYQDVINRAGSRIYGQMARLGLAEAQARAGQYDQAIKGFSELSQRKDGPLPVDGILMQLGRAYVGAGRRTEAQQTFNRLVQEYPDSPFTGDARKELDNLKKT
ncbi:MAG TPA: tetratricopeptide repeat protein [Vicinamibacterales bacterium]|jgi:TolA-binding protein|nr:tetratricopeptide repeat protein [Vicinamibacterales bacterium]